MSVNGIYTIQPEGYSYIIYKLENKNTINYYQPQVQPLLLNVKENAVYYIVKCKPTFVGYLSLRKVEIIALTPLHFLNCIYSDQFKNIPPTLLDNMLIHMWHDADIIGLYDLKQRYQCSSKKIHSLFKEILGLSFDDYQKIVFKLRRPTH